MSVNRKISNLPNVIAASIQDTDILPIVAAGVTSNVKILDLRVKLGFAVPAGGRTVTDPATYLNNNAVFNVKDFGAFGDGSHNDTAAVQLAYSTANAYALANGGALVLWPMGRYIITDTIVINQYRVHTRGHGVYATEILFQPTANKVLFLAQMSNTALIIAQGSFEGFALIGSGAFQKIAFDLWDTSDFTIKNVICTVGWQGATSIGIRSNGRELTRLINVTFFCDRPIHIRVNPNSTATETADHWHATDCYLNCLVATDAVILIDANCAPTNMTWDGQQSWIGGKYGLDYTSGGTTGVGGYLVTIQNLRYEQSMDATGYAVRWQGQSSQNIEFISCHFGGGNQNGGALIRNTSRVMFNNCVYTGNAGGVAFDITSNDEVWSINCLWQIGSVVVLGTLEEIMSLVQSSSPAPGTAYYLRPDQHTVRGWRMGGNHKYGYHGPLVNGGILNLPLLTVGNGLKAAVVTVYGFSATGPVREGGLAFVDTLAVTIQSGTANFVTTNTAGKLCLFFNTSGNPVVIINNTGQTLSLVVDITATYL